MPAERQKGLSVAVIGAGVVGLSTALWLQRYGHQVEIIDPAPPLPGMDFRRAASFGNAATIAPNAIFPVASPGILWKVPGMLLDKEGPFSLYWRDLPDLLPWLSAFILSSRKPRFDHLTSCLATLMRHIEVGHAPLMAEVGDIRLGRGTGSLHLYRSEAELKSAHVAMVRRNQEGIRGDILTAAQIREREPNLAQEYYGGALFHDAYVLDDPEAYCHGLARAIIARGGSFTRGSAEDLEINGAGLTVRTSLGLIKSDRVVLSAGAWSRDLARRSGQSLNLNTERGYHVSFTSQKELLSHPVMYPSDGFFLVPMAGEIRAAGTVELGGLDKPTRPVRLEVLERKARRMLPGLGTKRSDWLGFRPSTPDSLPFIGPSLRDPRLFFACGHGHLGLTLGGITGKLIAALVSGEKPELDLAPFSPGRSTSGLRLADPCPRHNPSRRRGS